MVLKYLNDDCRSNDFTFQCASSPTYDAYGIYGGINNKYVKYAKLVEYHDEDKRGIMPICHIVLEEEYQNEEQINIINDIVYNTIIANPTMSSRQIPSKFRIREKMPLTKNSKVDFNALKKEGIDGTEINVDVLETNLNVGDIKIYKNVKTLKLKK